MAAIDHEHMTRGECAEEFTRATGVAIEESQVSAWRARNGRTDIHRALHRGDARRKPVGSERMSKGYVFIKVKEEADVSQTRDNWRRKHVVEWERIHGPLPEGHVVLFADRDHHNFDADNLVAVPTRLMGPLNSPGAPKWHDRESLRACIALAELTVGTNDMERTLPRECRICGVSFVPQEGQVPETRTCPSCLGTRYRR